MKTIPSLILSVLFVLSLLCGCTRTIYQPIETIRNDSTVIKTEIDNSQISQLIDWMQRQTNVKDSIVIRDSVIYIVNEVGDVISKEVYHDRDRNYSKDEEFTHIQAKLDSIINAQREEINSLKEEFQQTPVPVEKPLSKWEKFKQDVGGIAIGFLVAGIIIAVLWILKKFKKK